MTPRQKENYISSMENLREQMHAIVDNLCNNALAAGLIEFPPDPQPINDLKPDPARREYRRHSAIKTQVCTCCGRELTLGQFRSRDNRLHSECNQCREDHKSDIKDKK